MKNLLTYEQFLNEDTPSVAFDGCDLKLGSCVVSLDGYSGVIISKEIVNGVVTFRDNKGIIHVCESQDLVLDEPINEDLQWWEVTKGILAADAIKVGASLAGGGLLIAAHLFTRWRDGIANKIQKIRADKAYAELKDKAAKIADKFNADSELTKMMAELQNYPYQDPIFVKGIRAKKETVNSNKMRSKIMRDIAKYVKSKLNSEEMAYFVEVNKVLRDKPLVDGQGNEIEEDLQQLGDINMDPNQSNRDSQINRDPNRTTGTGTYSPSHSDNKNVKIRGRHNTRDSASGGSYPVYIS